MFGRNFFNLDWWLAGAIGGLLVFGLLLIYFLAIGSEQTYLFQRQLIFSILGIVFWLLFSFLDYRLWRNYAWLLYIVGLFLLLLVFVLGQSGKGALSWFHLGFFNLQPVEFMKLALIIFLAKYFSDLPRGTITVRDLIISGGYVLGPVLLTVLQPDMGSALVLLAIWLGMVILAGLNGRQFVALILLSFLLVGLSWSFVLRDYQKRRVISFFNPQTDILGSGYNVIQATIAIGSGGLTGKGLGKGSQSQLHFVPERHTDFIFATLGEETGLMGVGILLSLFGLILFRLQQIGKRARDYFGRLLIGGIISLLFFHIFINIGMNLGLVPVMGISLPFISYGGSFLLIVMMLLGIAQSVWLRRKEQQEKAIDIF